MGGSGSKSCKRISGSLPHDTLVYLGGNEQSTHKYISELMGKATIDKRTTGETKGRQGSASRNYDVLGRELITPDEARKLDNRKCIIFIRGFDPIVDTKFIPMNHPQFSQTADGKGKPYVHTMIQDKKTEGKSFELLTKESLAYFEKRKKKGENVYVDSMSYDQFQLLNSGAFKKRFIALEEEHKKQKFHESNQGELEHMESIEEPPKKRKEERFERKSIVGEDTIINRMSCWKYTEPQIEELGNAIQAGIPTTDILSYFYPELSVEQMREMREQLERTINTD